MASEFDLFKDSAGDWYWVFTGANGEPIAKSVHGYKNRDDCLYSIRITRDLASDALVWDVSKPRHIRVLEKEITSPVELVAPSDTAEVESIRSG